MVQRAVYVLATPSSAAVNVIGDSTPVLIINETLDAATPYEGALFVRSLFPQSSLIAVVNGVNHANSLAGSKCVDLPIADFLSTGALPARLPGDGPDAERPAAAAEALNKERGCDASRA